MLENKIRNGLQNRKMDTKISLPIVPYPDHLFPLHTLGIFAGARNSGKTNACSLLIKDYFDNKSFTRLFIISPTYKSNPTLHVLGADEKDVYIDSSNVNEAINSILKKIEDEVKKYKDTSEYEKAYLRFKNKQISMEDQILLEMNDFKKPKRNPIPSPCLIIDDMSHTSIYSESKDNPFINLLLRHRHIFQVGMSIFMLVQNFKKGIPKILRSNTQVFFLYKTNDIDALENIHSEFGNICSLSQFLEFYKNATQEDKNFLTIDPFNTDKNKRFRKNFDTFLTFPTEDSELDTKILKLKNRKRKIEQYLGEDTQISKKEKDESHSVVN
jgi:hypothetical protein